MNSVAPQLTCPALVLLPVRAAVHRRATVAAEDESGEEEVTSIAVGSLVLTFLRPHALDLVPGVAVNQCLMRPLGHDPQILRIDVAILLAPPCSLPDTIRGY